MKSRTKLIAGSLLILSLAALLWANRSILTDAIARKEGVTVLRLKEIRTLQHSSTVLGVAWAPDGKRLATYSDWGQQITIWNSDGTRLKELRRADQKLVTAFPGPFTPVRQLSWSAEGRFLAAAVGDRTARVFAPNEPSDRAAVAAFDHPVSSVQFSPYGNELAVASGDAATIFKLKY